MNDGNRGKREREENFFDLVREQIAEIYLIIMLAIYPLFLINGYEDLVYKKWALFLYASITFVLISLILGVINRLGRKKEKRGLAYTDRFVLGYFICVLLSYFGAVDRKTAFWGVDTWYMGAVSQLLFIGIYFGISRCHIKIRYMKILSAVTFVIVSGIVILQRFGINVFHLYDGFGDEVRLDFVTTLGQVTWSSGYISILLAAGMGIYYLTEGIRAKIFWGICIGIGFAAEMVLNCDSGILAVICAMMVMLWLAIGNRENVLHLAEIVIITLTVSCILGILERIWEQRMVPIDSIYFRAAQSKLLYPLLAAMVLFYILTKKGIIKICGNRKVTAICRGIYLAFLCLGILGMAGLFILHGKNYFPNSPTENYFHFTIWWGNSRGFIWRTGAAVFADFNIWRKLFGCGPDCFTPYAYRLMGDAINEFWHNQIVPNVHNEWFNAVINYGIIGGIAYLGIFVSSAYCLMRSACDISKEAAVNGRRGKKAVVFGIGLASACYIVHNVLCYQQIIGTPLIFILMGIGVAISREGKEPE